MIGEHLTLHGYKFDWVGEPLLRRDHAGAPIEYTHQLPVGARANRYAKGPFCHFVLPNAAAAASPGVYAISLDRVVVYVGECRELALRFAATQYGSISGRNCHSDGQSTNCKLNAHILAAAKAHQKLEVWFLSSDVRQTVERDLIRALMPAWNGRRSVVHAGPNRRRPSVGASSAARFREELDAIFRSAAINNEVTVTVTARELHRRVGGYPGPDHGMPICCSVMRSVITPGDQILDSPPSGQGASLRIEYRLPRA